jgi:DNA invertase Pin-like site-specific DNA recombinase
VAKIVGGHRDRLAVVYLRQSSMAQVREHAESTMRQYGLVEEAVRLGWAREAVVVIDTDLGVSGRWGVARAFAELVARVCIGEVGAIFGIEISRLARSNAEVARLMEFAAITETLLIDADGVYDPGDVNDRMPLGLKSTMGEVELHVMAQRLQAAKRAAAARGALRTPLPVGYLHDELGAVAVDPDAEVQAAIRDLFAAFAACGSAYGVVAAFAGRRFPLRGYGGVLARQLRWGQLSHARVLGVLKNPCYASATPGRTCTASLPLGAPSTRTAACTPGSSNGPAASGRCSSATITTAISAGPSTWPTRPGWPATAPTPGRAHHARDRRCVRASSPAAPAASRCAPITTPTNAPPTSARAAPTGKAPRRAARSPRPPSTTRSPTGCWPR